MGGAEPESVCHQDDSSGDLDRDFQKLRASPRQNGQITPVTRIQAHRTNDKTENMIPVHPLACRPLRRDPPPSVHPAAMAEPHLVTAFPNWVYKCHYRLLQHGRGCTTTLAVTPLLLFLRVFRPADAVRVGVTGRRSDVRFCATHLRAPSSWRKGANPKSIALRIV